MTTHDFRHDARQAIDRAKTHLAAQAGNVSRLRYAALDTRMAMEALTYERAQSYQEELPKEAYDTWQPRKLLQLLLDIDPLADQGSFLRFGLEETFGQPAKIMHDLGAETVLDLSTLKGHYDALGSYLHMPSIKQMESGEDHKFDRLNKRLHEIVAYIDRVLGSPVFNINLGSFATMDCVRCKQTMRWRMPRDRRTVEATCRECSASYEIEQLEGDQVRWIPRQVSVPCTNPDCKKTSYLWREDVASGVVWACDACEHKNEITLMVRPFVEPQKGSE